MSVCLSVDKNISSSSMNIDCSFSMNCIEEDIFEVIYDVHFHSFSYVFAIETP